MSPGARTICSAAGGDAMRYTVGATIGTDRENFHRAQEAALMPESQPASSRYINFLLTISSACCEAYQRTRARSPGKLRLITSAPLSLASA